MVTRRLGNRKRLKEFVCPIAQWLNCSAPIGIESFLWANHAPQHGTAAHCRSCLKLPQAGRTTREIWKLLHYCFTACFRSTSRVGTNAYPLLSFVRASTFGSTFLLVPPTVLFKFVPLSFSSASWTLDFDFQPEIVRFGLVTYLVVCWDNSNSDVSTELHSQLRFVDDTPLCFICSQ